MNQNYITGFIVRFLMALLIVLQLSNCQQKPQVNVIIITFDTTRADHIGAYGNKNAQTPVLNQLASDGVLYEKSLAPIPITLPSHSSIMTGKVPFAHGVRDNGLFKLASEQETLAEILKAKGYQTAAAIGSFPLTSQFGINQGFDYFNEHITQKYEDVFGDRTIPKEKLFFDERKAAQVNDAIMPWIEDHAQSPFFVWLHYFDPHHPHEPPAPYNQSFVHDLYQGEIAYADESLGNIIAQLKRLNVYDNSIIVFTSDHGEGMGEHNESTHSLLVYNATLHVPLIVKYPNQKYANSRISNWVGSVDILPTILKYLNIQIPENIQGRVLPTEKTDAISQEIYIETLSPRFSRGWGEQRGLVKNGYKYIYGPQKELYNINDDPHEVNNLIKQESELADSMKTDLQNYIDEYQSPESNSSIDIDADTLNTLRGLGYVQSSGDAVEYIEEKLSDIGDAPQLHVDTISTYSQAKSLLFTGDYIEANRYLDALLLTDPDNLAYLELKIQADINLGNYQVAKETLKKLPDETYGTITLPKRLAMLAKIHYLEGDHIEAKILFEDAENIETSMQGQYYLANIYAAEKNYLQQQKHLLNILQSRSDNVDIINSLAISYAVDDDVMLAEQTFAKAIKINPYHQLSYYNYGTFLSSISDHEAAEKHFSRAIKLNKSYLAAHYALIETLIKQDKFIAAQKAFQKLNNLAPSDRLTILAKKLINKS